MRVLLINPFYPISETPSPPLGLAYLGAALEQAGVQVKILDYVVYPYRRDTLESVLKEFKPHIAGATAVSMTFDHAKQVLKNVKTIDSDVRTVMGGPHVTFCARETLESFPELDVVVLGEGEETFVDLTKAVENAHHLDTVNGITYRIGSQINTTANRKLIRNLDSLPLPARHLLPLGRYRTLGLPISITTSRGCPYKCIFCVGRKMVGAKVRYHSIERVVAELDVGPGAVIYALGSPDPVAEAGDGFGGVLATGDFNRDGYADLVIGLPSEDVGTIQDGGSVNVLYGANGHLQSTSPNDQTWHQNSANVEGITE